MIKKARDIKQTRKNNQNFFKYVQQAKPTLAHNPKAHTRSLIDLDSNSTRYHQSARDPTYNKENHQSSVCNHTEEEGKSNSLKKFLSLFGSTGSNPILNQPSNYPRQSGVREDKSNSKGSGRQIFTCNIKNMNVNVSSSKQKDNLDSKATLLLKNGKQDGLQLSSLKSQKEEMKMQFENARQQWGQKQHSYRQKIVAYQNQNSQLRRQLAAAAEQRLIYEEKAALRERSLQRTIQNLQNNIGKQRCREHELIIESLKKVINEQLRKIIELQKSKIEREEIQKLEERINLNMSNSHQALKERLHFIEAKKLLRINRPSPEQIKIIDDSFNESALTSQEHSEFEMIEQASENEEFSREKSQQGDSILEEVDKYLVKWRNKQ